VIRLALAQAEDLRPNGIAAIPGFLRSEAVLDHFGVTQANWRDAIAFGQAVFARHSLVDAQGEFASGNQSWLLESLCPADRHIPCGRSLCTPAPRRSLPE
jgi:hypothetical protein